MAADLGEFEKKPIRKAAMVIKGTGDGLSKAMATGPEIVHAGERRFVVVEVVGAKYQLEPMDDGDAWKWVSITNAQTVVFVDEDLVRAQIQEQQARNLKLEEDKKGLQQIPTVEQVEQDHEAGLHKRARKNCRLCEQAAPAKPKARKATKKVAAPRKRGRGKLKSV